MALSTANWHWKNKNVTGWGREWFERELTTITITGDAEGEQVSVSQVTTVEGDIELGQRKSKLITIYDCRVELEWTGVASDGTPVSGTLSIPEVSHEITLDGLSEYSYHWTLETASSPAVDALFALAKSRLPTALEVKFAEFPVVLVDTHGKDLTVSAAGTPGTRTPGTSTPSAAVAPVKPATAASAQPLIKQVAEKLKRLNTSQISVEATFMASAQDLFGLLTDENRIPMWSRAPAKSTPRADSEYSLFGGGVTGKYVSLDPPRKIVQTWCLQSPTWPSGHLATLTTTLDQSSDSTTVAFKLDGVPTGMEDEIRRNIEGYYVHGMKSIGLGSEL